MGSTGTNVNEPSGEPGASAATGSATRRTSGKLPVDLTRPGRCHCAARALSGGARTIWHRRRRDRKMVAGRSGRQDCNPAGGNPAVSIAQFGHVAIPHPVRVTVREYAWCKRPGRPESFRLSAVGATWGPSERGSLKRSEWLQPRKYGSLLKLHCRDSFVCRARFRLCEADALWEEMGACTGGRRRGMGPGAYARGAGITSGRAMFQRGATTTCKDRAAEGDRGTWRSMVWRMSPL